MPSSIGHAFAAAAVVVGVERAPRRFCIANVLCAVLLDLDAIGRPFGYGDVMWLGGHRALTHSLFLAAVLATIVVHFSRLDSVGPALARLWLVSFVAIASHGVLDAMATYGEGVMFFAPFSDARFKFPWQPFARLIPEILLLWAPGAAVLLWRWSER